MIINNIDKLWEAALPLQYDAVLEDTYSGHVSYFDFKNWKNVFGKVFNTRNGILVFTDNNNQVYAIPNFKGSTNVLKANGFRQDLTMPVPLSDGLLPVNFQGYWKGLQIEFRQCI